jgi:hypothetical protein
MASPRTISVESVARVIGLGVKARFGRFQSFPDRQLLVTEPLSLAEDRTNRLRRIYDKCTTHVWDGPLVFREAVHRHGGIQLEEGKRKLLASIMTRLMWGELAAWLVSAELAERLEDADARMAASSQVFDEARHFYVLRDYVALLHVPVPPLDPYFSVGLRSLLASDDLVLKLFAMQILVEGAAQSIFRFLSDSGVEPVLSEILPYIERDEARHIGLGVIHLPELLARLSPAECDRIAARVRSLGDLVGVSIARDAGVFEELGLDPRELFRRADAALTSLADKLGVVPGSGRPYFVTDDPADPAYARKMALLFPPPGQERKLGAKLFFGLLDLGARVLPS